MPDASQNSVPDARPCLVLCTRSHAPTAALTELLARRGWHATFEHDPHLALASLCLHQRSGRSRTAWGLDSAAAPLLVVCEPNEWPEFPPLADVIAAHLPDVGVWAFVAGELRELTPGTSPPFVRSTAPLNEPAPPRAALGSLGTSGIRRAADGPPRLRLTEPMSQPMEATDEPADPPSDSPDDAHSDASSARVTQQELDMLFQSHPPPTPPAREGRA